MKKNRMKLVNRMQINCQRTMHPKKWAVIKDKINSTLQQAAEINAPLQGPLNYITIGHFRQPLKPQKTYQLNQQFPLSYQHKLQDIDKIFISGNFYLMQNNVAVLSKQAVEAALKGNWDEAIQLNCQILETDKNNIDAKARLGRAYLQTKDFAKAKKLYKEVLDKDPINKIAQKNYKLAKEKVYVKTNSTVNAKALIKEPGTSIETDLEILAKNTTADDFSPGEELKLKIYKKTAKVCSGKKALGEISNPKIINGLNNAKGSNANIQASYVSGEDKKIKIVMTSSIPVFASEKQTVKPYLKKGTIDEPEIEIPLEEDEDVE